MGSGADPGQPSQGPPGCCWDPKQGKSPGPGASRSLLPRIQDSVLGHFPSHTQESGLPSLSSTQTQEPGPQPPPGSDPSPGPPLPSRPSPLLKASGAGALPTLPVGPCYLVNGRRAGAPASGSCICRWAFGSIIPGSSWPSWGGAGPAQPPSSECSPPPELLPLPRLPLPALGSARDL